MFVPSGNRYPFAFALLRGAAQRGLACCVLISILAAAAEAHPPWTRIAQRKSWAPDISWGPGSFGAKGASRLVEGGEGRLLLSQGDSLFLGRDGGRIWEAAPATSQAYSYGRRVALAADGLGLVLWGNRISRDFGRTWDPPRYPGYAGGTAYSIYGNEAWAGRMYDGIARSVDTGRTWTPVHHGRTYGSIMDFAYTWKGNWHLAAPQADQVLASRDGIAWTALASLAKPASGAGAIGKQGLMASILGLENMAYDQVLWAVENTRSGKAALAEIRIANDRGEPGADSFDIIRHAAASAPDSAVTALGIYSSGGGKEATLWLGTWGQGVFMSHDRGETWSAWNVGLDDLHVEALLVPRHGWNDSLYALTRDGLYRLGAPSSGLGETGRLPGRTPDRGHAPRSRFLLQAPSGSLFRPDGRGVTLPRETFHP